MPLPDDLPSVLRDVFDGCWRRQDNERPSIGEVRAQLEKVEQCVDINYKWVSAGLNHRSFVQLFNYHKYNTNPP